MGGGAAFAAAGEPVERSLIEQALSRTQGNVSRTAKLLQLQRTTLIEKINKYELRAGT